MVAVSFRDESMLRLRFEVGNSKCDGGTYFVPPHALAHRLHRCQIKLLRDL